MMNDELIQRLERIAKHATHKKGEEPYVMSLDDGVAILDAIDMIKTKDTVETCVDRVSRQSAIDAILDLTDFVSVIELFEYVEDHDQQDKRLGGIIDAIDAVLLLQSVQPERKKGEWLPQDHNKRTGYVTTTVYYYPKCSECGHTGNYGMNYCPSCGADMRGEQDG